MCNMKEVPCSDKHTENYQPTLQRSALQSLLASFSSLFWFSGLRFTVVVQRQFQQHQAAVFSNKKKTKQNTVHYLPSSKQQTDRCVSLLSLSHKLYKSNGSVALPPSGQTNSIYTGLKSKSSK